MQDKLEALRRKYSLLGQDIEPYLEGLLYSRSLTYWDYIELETLLTLQKPRTDFPDEIVFIAYHQITELYFKLIKVELSLLSEESWQDPKVIQKRLRRIERYFRHLSMSFEIMLEGMDSENFLRFRTALLPASGFQSVQFREIELMSTGLRQLLAPHKRDFKGDNIEELYDNIYWKFGNLDNRTGEKTLTLKLFEQKYDAHLRALAHEWKDKNLNTRLEAALTRGQVSEELIQLFREVDIRVNIQWRLVHFRTAAYYLKSGENSLPSTGGTNWQQYLPPNYQKIQFFPSLWTDEERAEWGKAGFIESFRSSTGGL
ncbi:MAG: tryptophan 2,3-dioxygenase family protein [Bacteroidia bacterium]|nr:tryptophan 2,3-dioxygenase family protein [Bacteroidia bacterium]MDW8133789.1 tryptophan 2,3-dioxygenase family protein [Bacteroidia bacterium]